MSLKWLHWHWWITYLGIVQLSRTPHLGCGGRRGGSCYSDHLYALVVQRIGPLASTQKMSVRFAPRVPFFILSPHRLKVRTPPFHGEDAGALPAGGTTLWLNSSKSSKERAPAMISRRLCDIARRSHFNAKESRVIHTLRRTTTITVRSISNNLEIGEKLVTYISDVLSTRLSHYFIHGR